MEKLDFCLTVHNPYRAFEGLLIHIKTNWPSCKDPERSLRSSAEEFLNQAVASDAALIYPPSQIALASVLHASHINDEPLDTWVTECLMKDADEGIAEKSLTTAKDIMDIVWDSQKFEFNKDQIKDIEKKLDKCRNQDLNPESQQYKRKMKEMLDDEEERQSRKYAKRAEDQRKMEEDILAS